MNDTVYEIIDALRSSTEQIIRAMPCKHKWNDPENISIYVGDNTSSSCTVQRCEYCNMIRTVKEV
jgi:hypothetical protein